MGAWDDLCPAIAAFGLPSATLPLPEDPVHDAVWSRLLSRAKQERVTGLLALAVAEGAMPATEEQAEAVAGAHRAAMTAAVALERTLVRTADRMGAVGIDVRVLKGPGVAHLDYPDPSLRSFGDIDLLVRSAHFDAAVRLLVGAGHRRRYPEPRPGFDRRFGKGSCLVTPDGHQVDLHRTLALGPFGLALHVDDLWETSSCFRLAGRDLHALGLEERFLHACFHSALGNTVPRLTALRDVAQILLCRPLDVERVLALGGAWRAEAVVARGVATACGVLGLEPAHALADWAARYRPTARERRAVAVYTDPAQTYAAKSFAAVRAVSGVRGKLSFVFALAFPRRRYIDEQREGRARRWRRGALQVVRSRRRRHPRRGASGFAKKS